MKGQMQQMFIMLMAIIVIGSTIYLGAKLLVETEKSACKMKAQQFQNEIREILDANKVQGSRNQVEVSPPCDAKALCFVDTRDIAAKAVLTSTSTTISSSVKQGILTNVFLEEEAMIGVGYDARLQLEQQGSALCIEPTGGMFVFRTIGGGRWVTVGAVS